MNEQQVQELSRCHSLPVLNREEAVFTKLHDHDGIISLMQTQIEFQSEKIKKHDEMFEDLLLKIQDITSKMKVLEDQQKTQSDFADQDALKSALWASTGTADGKVSIADLAKETAEQTLGMEQTSDYVYDEKLGLYFDQASGYYYDPMKKLFYNGHTRTYYSYDSATNAYQEVNPSNEHESESSKRKKHSKHKKRSSKHQKVNKCDSDKHLDTSYVKESSEGEKQPQSPVEILKEQFENDAKLETNLKSVEKSVSDMEEGEISSSSPTSAEPSPRPNSDGDSSSENEGQASYPPCIRAVVQENSKVLKKGTLFLVPFTGGTIGSVGSQHVILIPCPSVEELHAEISYQIAQMDSTEEAEVKAQAGKYYIIDLGSKEGTYLNRTRLSEPGFQSEPYELVHGSSLQVGEVTLLIHIHKGDLTCGHCEPGLIIEKDRMYEYTGKSSENVRKSELKKLKKKYGLDPKSSNASSTTFPSDSNYKDRAKNRRIKIGSDNPFAKTEVASAEVPIKESNVGFKMLKKMGWKGESLGNSESKGIKEPISCELKTDRVGLGFQGPSQVMTQPTKTSNKKSEKLAKTIERFNEANKDKESSNDVESLDY